MNSTHKKIATILLSLICTFTISAKENGEVSTGYPTKPITIIVPSSAGGGTDTMSRLFAKHAEKYIDQNFVIVNKPGAGGQIGFEAIKAAKKDGYTIGAIYTPHITAHVSSSRAGYTLNDFQPIANLVTDPGVLVVNTQSEFKSVEDIVKAEKANPGSLTGSTSGPGGDDFFALVNFNKAASISIKDVPASGSSDAKSQILGGHIDMAFMNYSQVESNVNAGDLKIVAVMTPKRLSYADQIPTFRELGYEVLSDSSRGFAAPKGIPAEALATLKDLFDKVLADEEFLEQAKGQLLLNLVPYQEYQVYLNDVQATTDSIFTEFPW